LDESLVDDRNVMLGFQESFEVSFLMIDEWKDNLAVISYESDLQYIQAIEEQNIQDCLADSSSHVSRFEMFFEEEIRSCACSYFFEDQEHTFSEVHYEGRSESKEKHILFPQKEVNLHVLLDPIANLL